MRNNYIPDNQWQNWIYYNGPAWEYKVFAVKINEPLSYKDGFGVTHNISSYVVTIEVPYKKAPGN